MSWLFRFRLLPRLLMRHRNQEIELDDEIQSYFEMLEDRLVEQGLPKLEARRVTRAMFEGPEQVKEKVRDVRTGATIVTAARDIKYAFRTLRKNPLFTAAAVLTLALGIGAATAIFSIVDAVLLRPLPYPNVDKLVLLFQTSSKDSREPLLLPDFQLLTSQSQSLSEMAVYYKNSGFSHVALTGISEPESVQGGYVSSNLFSLLGIAPSIGRVFSADEVKQGERVVVLSHRLWQDRFGLSPDLSGRTLEIDGKSFRVIGVMPAKFQFPAAEIRFWAPITTNRYWLDKPTMDSNKVRGFYARWNAVARLKPTVSLRQAQAEMSILAPRLDERNPGLNRGFGLTAVPLQIEVSAQTRTALWSLLAAVFLLLLIACVNATQLMLARGLGRAQEMAVRLSLGARQRDLLRQSLIESVVLSLAAGAGGVMLATSVLHALIAFAPANIPRLEQAGVDRWVLAFALAVSFLTAILSGFLPAWKSSRSSLYDTLKAGGRVSLQTAAVSRLRAGLVTTEVALTVILLVAAGLLIRSFLAVEAVDPGFNPENVLTMHITLPAEKSPASFYDQLLQQIDAIPGVHTVGAIDGLFEQSTADLSAAERSEPAESRSRLRVWATWKSIRGDYFQAMGIQLLQGRFFTLQDHADAPLVAIIDEAMARRYWPGENSLGKQFRGHDPRGLNDDPLTVIGVVRDTHSQGREAKPTPQVFQPVAQLEQRDNPATPDLLIRTVGDPAKLVLTVRHLARSLDRTAIISTVATMEEQLDEQTEQRRFQTWLLTTFSLLALLLASVGIYGAMHYSVTQRRHEIGIRMALGAEPRTLLRSILRQSLKMMAPGLLAGLLGARVLTTLLSSILFGIGASDPVSYLAVALLLTIVAMTAALAPAWRAATIDPITILRQE